ncbi:MAG: class I SAM-dependent methyltransferase [Campylobacterota bacterium]|nr:class I SAM-dependent methyltransferase [Campylobacterota bacterium]
MNKISNRDFYKKSIKEFGISAQGVHWNSKYTQYKRFEIITKLIKKEIKESSLVDVGCGFGEYYNYLLNNKRLPKKYIGIDCENYMIEVSKKRFPKQIFKTQDILKDDLKVSDYYVASGALNILNIDEVKLFIEKCFNASNKAFVFNYLKDLTFKDIEKDEIVDICKRYTKDITIKDDYLENDFTVIMRAI